MGSKKHKKHKSERRDKYEEYSMDHHRPSSLKLILKVGSNSTPEYGNDSPAAYDIQHDNNVNINDGESSLRNNPIFFEGDNEGAVDEYSEKHKKSKKKKKKKDREKKHKHHKEKRHRERHRDDSSQDEMAFVDDSTQPLPETVLQYAGITTDNSPCSRPVSKPIVPRKIEDMIGSPPSSPIKSIPESMQILIASPGTASTPGTISTTGYSTPGPSMTPRFLEAPKTPSSCSDSGREPRTCVLKLKQSKTPLTKLLDHLLRSLEKRDPHQFFAWPVTDDIAPGYSMIINQPMDFSTIRQKIEDNEYSTLTEFTSDFKLMCDNAIRYNHVETVYHKAAKKLIHIGMKMLQAESLMRSLKPLSAYMRDLTSRELGFEIIPGMFADHHLLDSADEGASTGAEELTPAQIEEEEKRRAIRLENQPKGKFQPYVDDLTSEEILEQVQNAARIAKKRLKPVEKAHSMGFLRQNKDGTTSMKILLKDENEGPEKVISLGSLVGKLKEGTGQLQGFREDRRNAVKLVRPLNYGVYSSFAPIFDSRFAHLSFEETQLVMQTYGDATSAEYAESIMQYTKDSSYASVLANGLLDVLTQGEHTKTIQNLYDNQCQRFETSELEKRFPDSKSADELEYERFKNTKIDFNKLRSLSELGIDVSFLDGMEEEMKSFDVNRRLEEHLGNNLNLIKKLHSTQHDRLSQPLPVHLSHVPQPGSDEIQLAHQITQNLVDISKKVQPGSIVDPHELRKAMGISNVGLPPQHQLNSHLAIPSILQEPCPQMVKLVSSDTSQVAMDIDEEVTNSNPMHTTCVDLESELREFLENGSGMAGVSTDDNSIEQMLLN